MGWIGPLASRGRALGVCPRFRAPSFASAAGWVWVRPGRSCSSRVPCPRLALASGDALIWVRADIHLQTGHCRSAYRCARVLAGAASAESGLSQPPRAFVDIPGWSSGPNLEPGPPSQAGSLEKEENVSNVPSWLHIKFVSGYENHSYFVSTWLSSCPLILCREENPPNFRALSLGFLARPFCL